MGAMTWDEVMASPYLKDLPFKIELNKWGRIEMSPASNRHAHVQGDMAEELLKRPGGRMLIECSVATSDGVRVPDVAWMSDTRTAQVGDATPFPLAPEICVEIMSPSNSVAEMHHKATLYIEAGAQEVWIVRLDGTRSVIPA